MESYDRPLDVVDGSTEHPPEALGPGQALLLAERADQYNAEQAARESAPVASTAPDDPFAFLLDADEADLVADLHAVGIDVSAPQSLAMEQRRAMASMFLRRAALARREAQQLEGARDMEIALIEMHYAGQIGRATDRARACEAAVESLAEIAREAGDFGKKKSASTPFGSFGFRETSETPELADVAALTQYAAAHEPEYVKATVTLPLVEARERFTDKELVERGALAVQWGEFKKTLDLDEALPPGVAVKPATRTFFAKPDLQALGAVGEVRA